MRFLQLVLILTAATLAALAGCSGEDALAPDTTGAANRISQAFDEAVIIGPSELVVGVDVSDSITNLSLKAIIDGLAECMADTSLFPADGSVSMSVLAYGDTIATVVQGLTPVTEASIKGVFGPALTALANDRLVTGNSAALSGFLDAAGAILATGKTTDLQVLVFSSGEADDAEAARFSCGQLGKANVRVSTLGIDPDIEGEKLLGDCAAMTGGYYETVVGSMGEACQRALARMLVVELAMLPETASLEVGMDHKVEVKLFEGGDPKNGISGVPVAFRITGGPNAGETGDRETDEHGLASFAYTGDGGAGIDTLVATASQPRTGAALADTVTATWTAVPQPPVCDAGGPYLVDVDADTVYVMLDGTGSSDADSDSLTFEWSIDSANAVFDDPASAQPELTIWGDALCADQLEVMLLVIAAGDSSICSTVIEFNELRQPTVGAKDPVRLWPPNHKYRSFEPADLLFVEGGGCDADFDFGDVVVLSVSSNEPEDSKGDGRTSDDIRIDCPNTVKLRAERTGGGEGRIYTVVYGVSHDDGSTGEITAYVYVPHDNGDRCADIPDGDGGGYTVAGCGDGE
ncbi:hypothetical protein DRQ53_10375 [bacterium]|nr:MAG: hypothetical protein DRQ53_10375 [bacterium]